ncbi:MAG: YgiT-type zinc finger protein, partial [Blastocatellia bacterium]
MYNLKSKHLGKNKILPCELCNSTTEILTNQTYHYLECGLDNVYLENIETRVCKFCGNTTARIPRITQLHNTIALALAFKDSPLTGKEVRFLRKRLNFKLSDWVKL